MTTPYDDLRDIAPTVIWEGLIARALHGAEATLTAIEIEPDTSVPEHAHANEQMGFLTAGSLTFRIGGEERALQPGGTWLIPANVPHSVVAGPEGARLIEVFSPPRTDWADRQRLPPSAPQGF
jgi:quercetin dioxygenase-like cupin family protein